MLKPASAAESEIARNSANRRGFDGSNRMHTSGFTTPAWTRSAFAPSISTVR